jgi:hypothetical protein
MLDETNLLLSMWRSLGQGSIPNRRLFLPFKIPRLLPSLFVLEVANEVENYRFRLAGGDLEQAYGAKAVGLTIGQIDVGSPETKAAMLRDYGICVRDRVAMLSRQTFMVETTGPYRHERLLLPFETDRPGFAGQIIGGLFFDSRYRGLTWKKAIRNWREDSNETFHPSSTS